MRASLPLDETHTHTHTAYSENNQQLPGSALKILLSHNCSRASTLSALVHPSQAANHEQPLWLALPWSSNRPTMEPIVSAQDGRRSKNKNACSIFSEFYHSWTRLLSGGPLQPHWIEGLLRFGKRLHFLHSDVATNNHIFTIIEFHKRIPDHRYFSTHKVDIFSFLIYPQIQAGGATCSC